MTTEETTGYPIPPDHCEAHVAYNKHCSLCGTAKRNHDAAVDARESAASEGETSDDAADDTPGDEKKKSAAKHKHKHA